MTSGGETPGIGVPGPAKPATRAPKAWQDLATLALVALPQQMSKTAALRRRLRLVRPR